MADVSTWSTTAASNNSVSPDGFPENMIPSGVNDSARENMAQIATWRQKFGAWMMENVGLTATVGSGDLTVTLRVKDGSTSPSSTNKVGIGFRSSTLTTGGFEFVQATSGISVVLPSGGTLGFANSATGYIFVYAINNAGTMELALSAQSVFDEGIVHSTTAIGTGSDSSNALYSTSTRTDVAIRLIGRITIQHGTGSWTNSPTVICLWSPEMETNIQIAGVAVTSSAAELNLLDGLTEVASQSTQETGTSETAIVVTGRQHYHPSASKGWVDISVSGGNPSNSRSYNVSSITDNGLGSYTVNWSTNFSNANYAVVATPERTNANAHSATTTDKASGSVRIVLTDAADGTLDTSVSVVAFGDL